MSNVDPTSAGAAADATGPSSAAPTLKDTLQLPRTDFSMRGNLAAKEPAQLQAWQARNLWAEIRRVRAEGTPFVLHDGPPYANGALHHGHVINKVLKDLVVKDRTMRGHRVDYVPGWDCHGLPIEQQVVKALRGRARDMPPTEVHAACADYAAQFVESQAEGFARLGVFADWSHPYRTMDFAYEAAIVRAFAELVRTGCVYRGLRPVHWCTVHQTALAEAEVEYETKRSPSTYVAFRLAARQGNNAALEGIGGPVDLVVWTTTPWSLPGNVAVAVHPEADYLVTPYRGRQVVVAEALWGAFVAATARAGEPLGSTPPPTTRRLRGEALHDLVYDHPFLPRQGRVVADDFVALDAGTGLVHSAPGHGVEDFALAQRHGLATLCPLDGAGVLTDAAGPFARQPYVAASAAIVAHLAAAGALLSPPDAHVDHRYAHCWRCHKPIVTRATQQWFLALDRPLSGVGHQGAGSRGKTLREAAIAALDEVRWVPAAGIERIRGMLQARPDWCLSRQRIWGVPVPVAYCARCEAPFLDADAIGHVADVFAEGGARAWYTADAATLFKGCRCAACGHAGLRCENDILDVWFDSGVSWAAVLEASGARPADGPPADLYLEGSDQHRGWFHSALLTSVATRGRPPYRQVLTHGFVVDGAGKKLSKSAGNAVDPFAVARKDGAELFRLWVASEDVQQDVRTSPGIMRQIGEHYRKLRNTLRYLLGNLHGFDPNGHGATPEQLTDLDRYMLLRHQAVVRQVGAAFDGYQYHTGTQALLLYCGTELSAFYCDVLKDRLYADAAAGPARRAAQTVLYVVARDLIRLLAPVLCFTAEEAWAALPRHGGDPSSVHLDGYPAAAVDDVAQARALAAREPAWREALLAPRADDEALLARYATLLQLRGACNQALEEARRAREVGASTEARLELHLPPAMAAVAESTSNAQLAELCIVSAVRVHPVPEGAPLQVRVYRADGEKCPRCWLYREDFVSAPHRPAVCRRCDGALR